MVGWLWGEDRREQRRTEDEFLRRREHVQRKGHFVLVLFLLHPFGEVCGLREQEGERGDGEEAYEGVGEGCVVGEGHVGGGYGRSYWMWWWMLDGVCRQCNRMKLLGMSVTESSVVV
jgi:hypothetical protein